MTDELWTFIACCAPFVALIVFIIIDTLLERSKLIRQPKNYEEGMTMQRYTYTELRAYAEAEAKEAREEGRQEVLREIDKMEDSEEFYFTKIKQWLSDRQITQNSTPLAQYGKFMEEALELHEALVRYEYAGVDDGDEWEALKDAIGDTWVTLVSVCLSSGLDMHRCVEGAYNEIKDRKGHLNEEGVFVKDVFSVGTGYRLLSPGEKVVPGDEYWSDIDKKWCASGNYEGGGEQSPFPYRRKL